MGAGHSRLSAQTYKHLNLSEDSLDVVASTAGENDAPCKIDELIGPEYKSLSSVCRITSDISYSQEEKQVPDSATSKCVVSSNLNNIRELNNADGIVIKEASKCETSPEVTGLARVGWCAQEEVQIKINQAGVGAVEKIIEAMENLTRGGKQCSSIPLQLHDKLNNILKNIQQMNLSVSEHKQTQTCMNEVNNANESKSLTLPMCIENSGSSNNASLLSLSNETENTLDMAGDCNGYDTEFICGTCDDTIVLYSNDFELSFQMHCQQPRHALAMGMKEKASVPHITSDRRNTSTEQVNLSNNSTLRVSNDAMLLSDEKLDKFRKYLFDIKQENVFKISVGKISYKCFCTICDITLHDLESAKTHLKGASHQAKFGKFTTKASDCKAAKQTPCFSCNICKEKFELKISLEKHMVVHGINFACQICKKIFTSKASLSQHCKDANHTVTNQNNKEIKLTDTKEHLAKNLNSEQLPQEREDVDVTVSTGLKKSNSLSMNVSVSTSCDSDVPLKPSNSDIFTKICDPGLSKSLNSKWVRVAGKCFTLSSVFNTFTVYGVIHKIILMKAEARILFQEELMASRVIETCKNLLMDGKVVCVSALSETDCKKTHGVCVQADLTLSNEAAHLISNEKVFCHICSRLLEEARCAEEDFVQVEYLCNLLEGLLKMIFPKCRSYGFGSRALGLATRNSDVDIFFDIGSNYFGEDTSVSQKDICHIVFKALMGSHECEKIEKVLSARVPIVKFVHKKTKLSCDVSFRCGLGHRNTMLLKHFLVMNNWLRPLILVAKEWLRLSKIQPGKRGMTSYTLILLIIFYLQNLTPALLPSVHDLQELTEKSSKVFVDDWDCSIPTNKLTITQTHHQYSTQDLLKGFFLFYGSFDFQEYVVCPLFGLTVKRSLFLSRLGDEYKSLPSRLSRYLKFLHKGQAPIFQASKPMCVQDPFELSHNVAKGVPEVLMVKFQAHCLSSHKKMMMWDHPPTFNLCNPYPLLKSRLFSS